MDVRDEIALYIVVADPDVVRSWDQRMREDIVPDYNKIVIAGNLILAAYNPILTSPNRVPIPKDHIIDPLQILSLQALSPSTPPSPWS